MLQTCGSLQGLGIINGIACTDNQIIKKSQTPLIWPSLTFLCSHVFQVKSYFCESQDLHYLVTSWSDLAITLGRFDLHRRSCSGWHFSHALVSLIYNAKKLHPPSGWLWCVKNVSDCAKPWPQYFNEHTAKGFIVPFLILVPKMDVSSPVSLDFVLLKRRIFVSTWNGYWDSKSEN